MLGQPCLSLGWPIPSTNIRQNCSEILRQVGDRREGCQGTSLTAGSSCSHSTNPPKHNFQIAVLYSLQTAWLCLMRLKLHFWLVFFNLLCKRQYRPALFGRNSWVLGRVTCCFSFSKVVFLPPTFSPSHFSLALSLTSENLQSCHGYPDLHHRKKKMFSLCFLCLYCKGQMTLFHFKLQQDNSGDDVKGSISHTKYTAHESPQSSLI